MGLFRLGIGYHIFGVFGKQSQKPHRVIRIFRRRIALDSLVVAAFGRDANYDFYHGSLFLLVLLVAVAIRSAALKSHVVVA